MEEKKYDTSEKKININHEIILEVVIIWWRGGVVQLDGLVDGGWLLRHHVVEGWWLGDDVCPPQHLRQASWRVSRVGGGGVGPGHGADQELGELEVGGGGQMHAVT